MPDDLSGWGYCGSCHAIHERDIDGYVCSDTRPLPVAVLPRKPGRLQRLLDWIGSRLGLPQRS